jgi:SNF2 family DNA or RNA helicase
LLIRGSKVKIKNTNSIGNVVEIKNDLVKVKFDGINREYNIKELDEIDLISITKSQNKKINDISNFVLAMDAFRLLNDYKFNPYVLVSSTKITIFPHQIDEVIRILDNPRMMIADEVGLGKTIIAALVATELRERGLVKRLLFVVPKSLVIKWKEELKNRFEIQSQILDSTYIKKYYLPFEEETFCYISSMDFLKQNHITRTIRDSSFDLVVIDEAHKLSYGTDRFALGNLLSEKSNFLLFLTATPHNGDDEDYIQRMRLLDPYFHHLSTTSHLMTRNIKEDVIDINGREVFPPRESKRINVNLSDKEIVLHKKVEEYISERLAEANTIEEHNAMRFLTIIIKKRASSSIYSLKNTLEKRIEKLGSTDNVHDTIQEIKRSEEDFDEESAEKNEDRIIGYTVSRHSKENVEISELLQYIKTLENDDSKLTLLSEFIQTTKRTDPNSKIVIFTEYRDTLNYLRAALSIKYRVGSIDGTMNIQERNSALIQFKDLNGFEIMICTDAAGEGIDMQFCNIEVNYDLPWNPTRLEQRMGRIHRIGQDRKVFYYNFILNDTIDGYILEKLLIKMDNIRKAIGDKMFDVIGRLVSEEEIATIFEELLKLPKEKWESQIKKMDGIIEEKVRLLGEINKLISGYRLDKSKLEEIKKNVENVTDKEDVKRFVTEYLSFYNSKLEKVDEDVFRIFLPKHIDISLGSSRIVEGTFNSEIAINCNYPYLALGNPYIMSLIQDSAKPSTGILEHDEYKGKLFVYKISIKDGKDRDRNGKLITLLVQDKNVRVINSRDIWNFKPSTSKAYYDNVTIVENRDIADAYAERFVDELLAETLPRLMKVADNTKEAIMKYYSKEIEKISIKLDKYNQKKEESPSFLKIIERENEKIRRIRDELRNKIDETEKDFDAYPVIELVGYAPVLHTSNSSRIKFNLERPDFIPSYSDFTKLNQRINSEYSNTTHSRLQKDPRDWIEYHRLYRDARKEWSVIPYEKMIEKIIEISPRLRIGDFGCGEAKIMEILGEDRVFSCDHIAINDKVTACDMKNVPLIDGSLDVVIFSLSLMGKNWIEYISEAKRCLWKNGSLLIAETTNAVTEGRLTNLYTILENHGFKIIKEEEMDRFTFIEAKKL